MLTGVSDVIRGEAHCARVGVAAAAVFCSSFKLSHKQSPKPQVGPQAEDSNPQSTAQEFTTITQTLS